MAVSMALMDVQIGDTLLVVGDLGGEYPAVVKKVSGSQIVIDARGVLRRYDQKVRKTDGRFVGTGDRNEWRRAILPDPARLEAAMCAELARRMKGVNWAKVDHRTLREVEKLLGDAGVSV